MKLIIREPGLCTTVQDKGRTGYQASGFPVSGCMDHKAAYAANILVNNPDTEAVLEMMYLGGTFEFTCATYIALTGADMEPLLNEEPVPMYRAIKVHPGDILCCNRAVSGRFAYLSVAGGFALPVVLGSKSTSMNCMIGGVEGRKLKTGDELPLAKETKFLLNFYLKQLPEPEYKKDNKIWAVEGPQAERFTRESLALFTSSSYTVAEESDRMGYRLTGPALSTNNGADIISDGIVFGSIQVPAKGTPMILLADHQTTGGYAKIGTVISVDLPKVVQCMPGDRLQFTLVSVEQAIAMARREERERKRMRRETGYCRNNQGVLERQVELWK